MSADRGRERSRRGRRRPEPASPREVIVTVERLGSSGDGVASLEGRPLFVPFTLPGERWRVAALPASGRTWRGQALEQVGGEVSRATPPCPHFGSCGGCALQHLPAETYDAFKRDRVLEPLRRAAISDREPRPLLRSPLHSRRRVRLAHVRTRTGKNVLGYRAARSHSVIGIETCPIARPAIVELLAPLRQLLKGLHGLADESEIAITETASGLDVVLTGVRAEGLADREALAGFAAAHDLARLSVAATAADMPETVAGRRAPVMRFGAHAVELPARGFLQATAEGEAALQAAVGRWLQNGSHVADLFGGLGTLTLPHLERLAQLTLVEGDAAACAAVERALAQNGRVKIVERDLDRAPLTASELDRFDTVVLDPPRAGASSQVEGLAASRVDHVIYASCHPGSFARDAGVLKEQGFALTDLQPVDQFLYAAEVELVARFLRPR